MLERREGATPTESHSRFQRKRLSTLPPSSSPAPPSSSPMAGRRNDAAAGEGSDGGLLESAERLILRWEDSPTAAPVGGGGSIFGGSNRGEAERYLRAVDEIRRSISDLPASAPSGSMHRRSSSAVSPTSSSPSHTIQIAMNRLEDEFRSILSNCAADLHVDSLDLESLSITSSRSSGDFSGADELPSEISDLREAATETDSSRGGGSGSGGKRRSRSSISGRSPDLVSSDALQDLRGIAERMISSGYGRECTQAYAASRKAAVDHALRRLGIERQSIGDVQRLDWDVLETKIRRWSRSARVCVRVLFAGERRLCDLVFDGLLPLPGGGGDAPFAETVKGAAIQLLSFPEAIGIGRRSPEKLFKIIDLHDALDDLLPDIGDIFRSKSPESIYSQAADTLARLAEAVRGTLSEFESAVLRDFTTIPVAGGTIHPLTRYVMNYVGLISDYKQTLNSLIVTKPSSVRANSPGGDGPSSPTAADPCMDFPSTESKSPLASHLIWIIVVLQRNLVAKSNLYKDAALSHLFLLNNIQYIVHKVKDGSPELLEMVGEEYVRRLTVKFRHLATSYQRTTWGKILHYLRDEGVHISSGGSGGGGGRGSISKAVLRERFRCFNAAFEAAHKTQATWLVPEQLLREELRLSIAERLVPAYRSFLGRYRQFLEGGRHSDPHIKYSVEDLEAKLLDFFEGCPPSPHGKRRTQ